jgi:hypothetical protein
MLISMLTGQHVQTDRLSAFMLGQSVLSEAEHCHLVRCSECMDNMAAAVLLELDHWPQGGTEPSASTEDQSAKALD